MQLGEAQPANQTHLQITWVVVFSSALSLIPPRCLICRNERVACAANHRRQSRGAGTNYLCPHMQELLLASPHPLLPTTHCYLAQSLFKTTALALRALARSVSV